MPHTHGVQTSTVPSAGAGKALGTSEFVLEVGLLLCRVVEEEGSVVEALDARVGGADGSGRSSSGA